ncbi:hypothetical protein LXL04_010375 [Taraxacum kok-saghyz]
MTSGTRLPTWKERENNKRRERRRRAIAAKIFAGLRVYGNYKLPKHCDNNEVLKALCNEAGWIVEEDGTTYRKGSKPVERMETTGGSTSAMDSPCSSSYQPSPNASSYNFSPTSSSIPSPISSLYNSNSTPDPNSLIPWLKNLSSGSLSSPTCRTPRMDHDQTLPEPAPWPFSSTPHSPGIQTPTDSGWLSGVQTPQEGPSSPTFSLVANHHLFGRILTPGQSGTCSPAVNDVSMSDAEFAFGGDMKLGLVKAWEGERIHEECVSDDLELTLGNPSTRC